MRCGLLLRGSVQVTCTGQAGAHDDHHEFPWWSPGTAPSFSPCGALGGQPDGCAGDGKGELGDCCSGNCDTFGLGLPAGCGQSESCG